jgi:hypothetical protein
MDPGTGQPTLVVEMPRNSTLHQTACDQQAGKYYVAGTDVNDKPVLYVVELATAKVYTHHIAHILHT